MARSQIMSAFFVVSILGVPIEPAKASPQKQSIVLTIKPDIKKIRPPKLGKRKIFAQKICKQIAGEAQKNNLPTNFFARLIWQESRFDPLAVSPAGAQGIAQFMPGTAAIWKLDDPFDPGKALAKSAQYLSWLHKKLGNLGLAAAGYNAGSGRVVDWLASKSNMSRETRNYVAIVTGHAIENWKESSPRHEIPPIIKDMDFKTACIQLASRKVKLRKRRGYRKKLSPKNWGVNIAQGNTEKIAMRKLAQIKQRFPNLVGKAKMRLVTLKLARKAQWTMKIIQIPTKNQREARALCKKIWNRGGYCLARGY